MVGQRGEDVEYEMSNGTGHGKYTELLLKNFRGHPSLLYPELSDNNTDHVRLKQ